MRALSIRQPFAEEILRGIKRIEFRPGTTTIIGERFYIYATKGLPDDEQLRGFATLCKSRAELKARIAKGEFLTGKLIGTAVITRVTPPTKAMPYWHWHLGHVKRLRVPRRLRQGVQPQPAWFYTR